MAEGGAPSSRSWSELRLVLLPLALLGLVAAISLGAHDGQLEPASQPDVELVEVGRFDQPLYVASPPGDERLFVVEKKGRIWVLARGRRLPRPFLDLSRSVEARGPEEGLLSIAFAPDYAESGIFYVDYTDRHHRTVVEEYRRAGNPNLAHTGTARRLLVIPNPTTGHHGGLLLFGTDGRLYIGQGDGGNSSETNFPAQSLDNLHGKILRIDPRPEGSRPYGTPGDNPFVGRRGRDETWVYGLRNPWRFGFDSATGALVIGDVGELSREEIDIAPAAGLNFGWSCFEGSAPYFPDGPSACTEALRPAVEHFRGATPTGERGDVAPTVTRGRPRVDVRFLAGEPACSIVAGVEVRDPALPDLRGRFLYGDFCDPAIRSFRVEGGRAVDVQLVGLEIPSLSSFGVDASGRIFATSLAGAVYRLAAS